MMLADLMLQKSEWEAAIYHFQQLLEKTPAHFRAMVKLLQLLRRAGRLKEASRFLKQAERSSPRAALEPGFRFCQGLLHRYMNDPRAALKALNMARRDPEWGEFAVQNMVEIYLNPENETNWDDIALDQRQEIPEAVRAAQLLAQTDPEGGTGPHGPPDVVQFSAASATGPAPLSLGRPLLALAGHRDRCALLTCRRKSCCRSSRVRPGSRCSTRTL